jgi:hypothetical protein
VYERVGDKRFFAEFAISTTRVTTVALFDWENVYCYQMSWRSWAWQVHRFAVAHKL